MKGLFRFVVTFHLAFFCTVAAANFFGFESGTWARALFMAGGGFIFYGIYKTLMNWSSTIYVTDEFATKTLKEWKEEQEK